MEEVINPNTVVSPVYNELHTQMEIDCQEEQLAMLKLRRAIVEDIRHNINDSDSWEDIDRKEYIEYMLRLAQLAY